MATRSHLINVIPRGHWRGIHLPPVETLDPLPETAGDDGIYEIPSRKSSAEEETCPQCHRVRSEWRSDNSEGFNKGGKTYCCEACATGGHCTCELMQTAPRLERNTDTEKPQGDK